jgi:hypothetical protein
MPRTPARPARTSRVRSHLRLAAVIAAAGLVAAGCTSSADDDVDTGAPLPGITDTTVKVGYIIVDNGELQNQLGFKQADYGDVATVTRGIQAVVDHANANGGAGGRTIVPEYVTLPATLSSPETVAALCAALTQDKQVFAAVLDGQFQDNALPCYRAKNTLMLDQTVIAHDQKQFEDYAPYLWSPTLPEYGSFLTAHLETLKTQGFFNGNTGVQLLTSGDEVSRRVSTQIAEPWMTANGITKMRTDYIDSTDQGTLSQSAALAIDQGKNNGFNRVVTVGGARILPVTLADFGVEDYDSTWAISSFDNPAFVQNNPNALVTARRVGMMGLGFSPPADVSTDKLPLFPDTTNQAQLDCMNIINGAGATPPEGTTVRENWRLAMAYCDSTMLIKKALDAVGDDSAVTATEFAEGVWSLGDSYRAAGPHGSAFSEGVYAAANAGRALAWNEACVCFDYVGEIVTFAAPVAATAAATDPAASVSPSVPPTPPVPVSPTP